MKRLMLAGSLVTSVVIALSCGTARAEVRSPIGDWLTGQGGAVVRISPCSNGAGLCGRIVGLMLDAGVPEPADYRGRPQCGFELIRPSEQQGELWRGGIVDPRNGDRYHAEFHVTRMGELALRGYIGLPIFGQTQHWLRYQGRVPRSCRINQAQMAQSVLPDHVNADQRD